MYVCIRRVRGHVCVYQESERSCMCVLGEWKVMYVCIRRVRGHVCVYQESERSCMCVLGV